MRATKVVESDRKITLVDHDGETLEVSRPVNVAFEGKYLYVSTPVDSAVLIDREGAKTLAKFLMRWLSSERSTDSGT